jgi:hypothetical protein
MTLVVLGGIEKERMGRSENYSFEISCPVVHGAMDVSQKSFMLVWHYHQLLSGFQ